MIKTLVKLANSLDSKGLYDEASEIDAILKAAFPSAWEATSVYKQVDSLFESLLHVEEGQWQNPSNKDVHVANYLVRYAPGAEHEIANSKKNMADPRSDRSPFSNVEESKYLWNEDEEEE